MSPAKRRPKRRHSSKQRDSTGDPRSPVPHAAGFPALAAAKSMLLAAFVLAAVAAGGVLAWRRLAPAVEGDPRYTVRAERVEITPPPAWVRGDVKGEALRNAGLEDASILDPALGQKIAQALAFHPWVESVGRVTLRPGPRVEVELVYRRPVAMVELVHGGDLYLSPVDRFGFRLPDDGVSPLEKRRYPVLASVETEPLIGQAWRDPRVLGGVQVAAELTDIWTTLQLDRIVAEESRPPAGGAKQYLFTLVTQQGRRIPWGHAPDDAPPDEMSAAEKRARLLQYARQFGSLDADDQRQTLIIYGGPEAQLSELARPAAPGDLR